MTPEQVAIRLLTRAIQLAQERGAVTTRTSSVLSTSFEDDAFTAAIATVLVSIRSRVADTGSIVAAKADAKAAIRESACELTCACTPFLGWHDSEKNTSQLVKNLIDPDAQALAILYGKLVEQIAKAS